MEVNKYVNSGGDLPVDDKWRILLQLSLLGESSYPSRHPQILLVVSFPSCFIYICGSVHFALKKITKNMDMKYHTSCGVSWRELVDIALYLVWMQLLQDI